jgi:hypothetical protein
MDTRPIEVFLRVIRLAKKAFSAGEIEADELEERIGHALAGRAVLAPDVPVFDRPQPDKLTTVRG